MGDINSVNAGRANNDFIHLSKNTQAQSETMQEDDQST
jgi:hypothetical protein